MVLRDGIEACACGKRYRYFLMLMHSIETRSGLVCLELSDNHENGQPSLRLRLDNFRFVYDPTHGLHFVPDT